MAMNLRYLSECVRACVPGAVATVLQYVVRAAEITEVVLRLDGNAAPLLGVEAFGAHLVCSIEMKAAVRSDLEGMDYEFTISICFYY